MQRCPKCKRTYLDDNQKFCTFDGGRLEAFAGEKNSDFDPEATMLAGTKAPAANIPNEPVDPFKTMAAVPTQQTGGIGRPPTGPVSPLAPTEEFDEGARTLLQSVQPQAPAKPEPVRPNPVEPRAVQPEPATHPTQPAFHETLAPHDAGPGSYASAPLPPAMSQSQVSSPQVLPSKSGGRGRKLLIIAGVLLILFVVVVAVAGVGAFLYLKSRTPSTTAGIDGAAPGPQRVVKADQIKGVNPSVASENASMPADAARFENSLENLNENLASHFVDFSFYYPNSWTITPAGQGSANFVEVDRRTSPEFSQENLTVGWYKSKGTLELDREGLPALAASRSESLSQALPEYSKVSEGETTVNSLPAYEIRFTGVKRGTAKGDIDIWGRVIFVPPGDERKQNGVTLLMYATSLAPGVSGTDDVGVKGELPVILNSFRMED
jgi:hypothetical protein